MWCGLCEKHQTRDMLIILQPKTEILSNFPFVMKSRGTYSKGILIKWIFAIQSIN